MYLKPQKCQEKSRNTVIAHRSRWHVSRSNEYKFATSCSGWINHPNLTQKRMDIHPDSVHTCYTIFSCKHGENWEIFSCKAFYLNCNLTDKIRTFPIPSSPITYTSDYFYFICILMFLCCNVRILKNRGIVRHTDVISENKR